MAGIKVGTRKHVQLGQANPVAGNTKWISNAMAAGRGAMDYGNQIMRTSQQVTSTVMAALEKGDKVNQLNTSQGNFDKWEGGLLAGSSEYSPNSPMGVMTSAAYGQQGGDGMLSNSISPKNLASTVSDMYRKYMTDHIDTIKNKDVRAAMYKYHGAKYAAMMTKVQGHVVNYTRAQQSSTFLANFDNIHDAIPTNSVEQNKEALITIDNMMSQVKNGVFPSLNTPAMFLTLDNLVDSAKEGITRQNAYRSVTFNNPAFDHPESDTTKGGIPVVTTVEDYNRAIDFVNGDFSALLNDPNVTEEHAQAIMDAVNALDVGDPNFGSKDSNRSQLLTRLETDRAIRVRNIGNKEEAVFAKQLSTLQAAHQNGTLTYALINATISPNGKSAAMFNQYLSMLKQQGKATFSSSQISAFRSIEADVRSGSSEDPEIQQIIEGYITNPVEADNAYLGYLIKKFGFVPDKYWTKATKFLKTAGKDWKVSKAKQNLLTIAENAMILYILKPDEVKAKLGAGENLGDLNSILAMLQGADKASITEARLLVQTQMINFEEMLDKTLKLKKESDGTSFADQLRAPLYKMDKNGKKHYIGDQNKNWIGDTLIQEQLGGVDDTLFTKHRAKIRANQVAENSDITNAQKRTIYNAEVLTEKLATALKNDSLIGKEVTIKFTDGSNFAFVAPDGMTVEDGRGLYFSKIAMMQTGDASKVVRLPADHPIPEGWTDRTEPYSELKKRKALIKSGALTKYLNYEELVSQESADIINQTKIIETLDAEIAAIDEHLDNTTSNNTDTWTEKKTELESQVAEATTIKNAAELGVSIAQIKDMDVEIERTKQKIAAEAKALAEINKKIAALETLEITATAKEKADANKTAFDKFMDVGADGLLKTGQFLTNFLVSDFYGMGADARHAEEWIDELKYTHATIEKNKGIDYSSYESWKETGSADLKSEEKPTIAGYNFAKDGHDYVVERERRLVDLLQGLYERRNYTSGDGITYFDVTPSEITKREIGAVVGEFDIESSMPMDMFEEDALVFLRSLPKLDNGGKYYIVLEDGKILK